jgi:hypothetical protein
VTSGTDAYGQMDGRTNSLIPFLSSKVLLWRIYVASKNKTYLCLYVNCPLFFPILTKSAVSRQIFIHDKSPIPNFTKISPLAAALMHADRTTDGCDEANKRFSQLCECSQKLNVLPHIVFVLSYRAQNTQRFFLWTELTAFSLYGRRGVFARRQKLEVVI